jgi:hypothetical protein
MEFVHHAQAIVPLVSTIIIVLIAFQDSKTQMELALKQQHVARINFNMETHVLMLVQLVPSKLVLNVLEAALQRPITAAKYVLLVVQVDF